MKIEFPLALVLILALESRAQVIETFMFNNLNLAIPDGNAAGLSDRRTISSPIANISSLRLKLHIAGEFNGDLYVYLRHVNANGTNFCVLLNRPGRSAALSSGYDDSGLDVTFDESASNGNIHNYRSVLTPPPGAPLTGTWRPDGRNVDPEVALDTDPATTTLNSFTNIPAGGEWTLFVADMEAGGTNMLSNWELEINGIAVPPVTWATPADIVFGTPLGAAQLNASSAVSGIFTYTPTAGTILNAGPAQTLSVTFTPADTASYVAVTTNVAINVARAPTSGIVSSSGNPALPGVPVTFAVQINPTNATGSVQFKVDGTNFGSAALLDSTGRTSVAASLSGGLHTVVAEYAGDSNFIGTTNALALPQLVNAPPLAGTDTLQRSLTNGVKVLISTLLANDLDADGDAITFLTADSSSASGGSVVRKGNWIHYTPPSGFTNVDSFTYQIADIHNASATGLVFITNQVDTVPSPNLLITDLGNGSFLLRFDAIPGKTYRIEYSEALSLPVWQQLGSATANTSGVLLFIDTPPLSSPQRYYRSVYP